MRMIFNVAHPAHVHLFKNPIMLLREKGHEAEIVALEREVTKNLLKTYGFQYLTLGRSHRELLVKSMNTIRQDFRMVTLIKRLKADLVVSTGIPYSAQAARLCGVPSIAFSDTEIATLVLRSMLPFVSAVCTPSCFGLDLGPKQVRYDGYHELAYLHPRYFSPDPSVLDSLELERGDSFFLLRFSSADSSHDLRTGGSLLKDISVTSKLVRWFERYGRVFITSEIALPAELRKYELRIQPHLMHDLLSFARLYVGEGATMASEAGVLGVPWIYVSNTTRGYLTEQESKYGLGHTVQDWSSAKERISEWMKREDLESTWQTNRQKLLRDKIDVSAFIAEFVEDWPQSFLRLSGGSS
ncbi:MAG: DUF354 domain-containing protein [Thermoplasmata archaeon]|nr:DUF354 domain-containing protein [Thermoplasmata archaeon]